MALQMALLQVTKVLFLILSDEDILKDMDQDDFMIFQMCWQWLVTPMKFSLCMR
jgi:hypothetical protein